MVLEESVIDKIIVLEWSVIDKIIVLEKRCLYEN
jgi:hypothetical protein